jgi:hypothetical protein
MHARWVPLPLRQVMGRPTLRLGLLRAGSAAAVRSRQEELEAMALAWVEVNTGGGAARELDSISLVVADQHS